MTLSRPNFLFVCYMYMHVYYLCESVCVRTACMCHLFMYEPLAELVTLSWTWLHSHSVGITESLLAPLANYSWVACWRSFPMALLHMHRSARDARPLPGTTPRQQCLDRQHDGLFVLRNLKTFVTRHLCRCWCPDSQVYWQTFNVHTKLWLLKLHH